MKKVMFLTVIIATMLQSCAQVYRSNMVSTPTLREKGETSISGGLSRNGLNFSGAAAVSSATAVMINTQHLIGIERSINLFDKYPAKGNYVEGGIGFFKQTNSFMHLEVFGGLGAGKIADSYQSLEGRLSGNEKFAFQKIFLQPNLAITPDEAIDIIFTPRVGYVKGTYTGAYLPDPNTFEKPTSIDFVGFEPTLTINIGNKYAKVTLQGGMSITEKEYLGISSLFNFGAGVKCNFGGKSHSAKQ